MWAQEWQNLFDLLIPFKGKTNVDITPVLKARVSIIVTIASDFLYVCIREWRVGILGAGDIICRIYCMSPPSVDGVGYSF
jgi:hypothetical protein